MRGTRANGLLAACLGVVALVLAVHSLRSAPDPDLVARWWFSSALFTAVLVLAPIERARILAGVGALLLFGAGVYAGTDVALSLGFAVAGAVEAMLVLRWLTGFGGDRPQLRTWFDYRSWLVGIALGSSAGGAITAMSIGIGGGEDLWQPLLWVTITHLGAQAVVLPLLMQQPRHRIEVSAPEILTHLLLLALVGYMCARADMSEPVAFLLLPLLMWAAARFTPQWARIELLALAAGGAALTAYDRGPFTDVTGDSSPLAMVASSQSFIAVSAITSVAFSVAMGRLRDSLRRIRENEVQLGQLLDSASGTAFIATDLDGLITLFSPGAEQLLGYTGEEVVGRITPVPFHDSRELSDRAHELRIPATFAVVTNPVARGAEQDTRDWTFVRKDGSRLTVSLSVTAVRDDDGRVVSYLSVFRDITDRRAAEQALVFALDKERETNHRMQELDRVKGEFVSAVSHELRTPLTSIRGYAELLGDDLSSNLTQAQHQLVERIDRNGERLLQLVEDLLTLARVEDGNLLLDRVATDLRDAVRTATDEVAHAAHKSRVSMHVSLPAEPVQMLGDPSHLERLVLNLVSNAVKFTPEGGHIKVTLRNRGEVAELRVIDTGMGIPLEEQGQLFQRFFRSSLATKRAIQGTGLGLHIVRSIAEAHHGTIDFESTPGVGTTFLFSVPVAGTRSRATDTHPELEQQPAPDLELDQADSERAAR